MKNLLTIQRLKIISLVIPAYTLLIESFPLTSPPRMPEWVVVTLQLAKFSDLSSFPLWFLTHHDFDSGLSTNFLNAFFCFAMFCGALLFWKKEQKEVRLLRFCYAVLLLINIVGILNVTLNQILHRTSYDSAGLGVYLLIYARIAVALYISWFALKVLNDLRTIAMEPGEAGPNTVLASRWHRFFHLIVDTVMASVIFLPFIFTIAGDFMRRLSEGAGERPVIFLMLLISRMLYYPFYETLFGATPAKMFSESRVITRGVKPITLDQGLYRTIARFVPFEAFSFLGSEGGWHDRWTETSVVKEVRQGVRGARYFLVIPIALTIGGAGYVAHSLYKSHLYEVSSIAEHNRDVATIESGLKKITTNTIIQVKSSSYDHIFLKIEDISNNDLYCSIFEPEEGGLGPYGAGEFYKKNQYSLNKVMINRNELWQSYPKEYRKELVSNRKSLLNDDKTYEIEKIFDLDLPLLRSSSSGVLGGNEITLYIENCGWGGVIKEIRTTQGEATFATLEQLPYEVKSSSQYSFGCATIYFNSRDYEPGEPYTFEFIMTDQSGNDHKYQISGTDMDRSISEMFVD